jgi:hypothetical protein
MEDRLKKLSGRLEPGECVTTAGARDGFSAMQAFQAMPLPSSSALRGHDRMGATPIREYGDQRPVKASEPILSLSAGAERSPDLVFRLQGFVTWIPASSACCACVRLLLVCFCCAGSLRFASFLAGQSTDLLDAHRTQGQSLRASQPVCRSHSSVALFRAIISHRAAALSN